MVYMTETVPMAEALAEVRAHQWETKDGESE